MRTPIARTVLFLFALLPVACSSGGGGPAAQTADLGPSGGSLVGTGALAGVQLTVPPASLAASVQVTATATSSTPASGYAAVGQAVQFGPAALAFAPAATLVLPFETARLPGGVAATAIVVERRDATGALTQLVPTSIDPTLQRVTLPITAVGTYWAAVPDDVFAEDYLPPSGRWTFDSGLVAEMNPAGLAMPAPPLPNIGFLVLAFTQPGGLVVDALPLSHFANGDTVRHGAYHRDPTGTLVERHNPTRILQEVMRTGAPLNDGAFYEVYRMPDGLNPIEQGNVDHQTTITRAPAMTVPAGTFADVVRIDIVEMRTLQGSASVETTTTTMWCARDVGPIRIQAGFAGDVRLTAHTR